MKNFYLVNNGEAQVIDREELQSYPFYTKGDGDGNYSEDWHLYESAGAEWCIAYAKDHEEALNLTDESVNGLVARDNVWCEIGRVPYESRVK